MDEKIRIAYLVRPAEGGIRVHLLTLLAGLDRSRFEPTVICPPGISLFQEARQAGVEVVPLDIVGELSPSKDLQAVLRLRRILRDLRPDILHMHSSKAGLIGRSAVLGLSRRPKIILTEHAFIFDERTTGRKRALIASAERILSRITDRIVTVSEALRQELISEMQIEPSKIVTIHNGVVFAPLERVAKPGKLVGTVSRLAPQKGVDHFLRAAALIHGRVQDARFAVIGDGPLRGELESLAESLGIRDRIEFLGHRSDAIEVVRTFDVFVLASTRESFGLTLVEALSQEIPVVASRTGGIPEIVDGETTGLLAEPGNAEDIAEKVCRLLDGPEFAHRLAEEGCKSVRARFSAEVMVEKTQNVYLEGH